MQRGSVMLASTPRAALAVRAAAAVAVTVCLALLMWWGLAGPSQQAEVAAAAELRASEAAMAEARSLAAALSHGSATSVAALEAVHSPHVVRLASLSGAPELAFTSSTLAASAMPFVRCERLYRTGEHFRLLAECLPFAARGALMMVEPAGVSLSQCRADAALALALGRAGFLVIVTARDPWPCAPHLGQVDHFVRLGPSVFVQVRRTQLVSLLGYIAPGALVPAPILLMGPVTSRGEQLDTDALHRSGSRVVVVGAAGSSWSEVAARSGDSDEDALLLWAACRSSVAAVVMRDTAGASALANLPCGQAATECASAEGRKVAVMAPRLARGTPGAAMGTDDAEAAQIASLLASMPPLGGWSDAVGAPGGAGPGAPVAASATQGCSAKAAANGVESNGPGASRSSSEADDGRPAERSALRLAGTSLSPLLRVPVARPDCADVHGLALVQWLLRCMPGRRGLFVQSRTMMWDTMLFQRPQHMARALANRNALVLYMSMGRVMGLLRQAPGAPGVFLADESMSLDAVAGGAVVSLYSTMYWLEADAASRLEAAGNVAVYEYIDAIDSAITYEHSDRLIALRDQSSSSASVVVYTAAALRSDLRGLRKGAELAFVPNGVYPPMYAPSDSSPVPGSIADLVRSGRPMVGYFGAVASWIWQELLVELARAVPEADFVIIGPAYAPAHIPPASTLPPNLRYLGGVPAQDLVLYARHWAVGIIPFRHGDIARTTSPLKLFEYFALGLPVVVTDNMAECTKFDVVRGAADPPGFAAQVRAALEETHDENLRTRIRALAEANSWDHRADDLLAAAARSISARNSS